MDRLLNIDGGQKLRAKDWALIQDVVKEQVRSLVVGLKGSSTPCIITGLTTSFGDASVAFTEGVLFYEDELFFVPAANFTGWNENKLLYLSPNITTGENRVFKDTTTHDVYQYRRYQVGMGDTLPEGSMLFPSTTLIGLISAHVIALIPAAPAQLLKYTSVTYTSGSLSSLQTIVPAPGAGKAIRVISLSVMLSVTTQLNVGDQDLNILMTNDESGAEIGTIPNALIESDTSKLLDMIATPGEIYINKAVQAQYSSGAAPTSGSASLKFHCHYVVITL